MFLTLSEYEYNDRTISPDAMIDVIGSFVWHRRYQGVGEFQLKVPFSREYNAKLECGRILKIAGRDEPARILTKTIRGDAQSGETIELTGKLCQSWFSQRVITNTEKSKPGDPSHLTKDNSAGFGIMTDTRPNIIKLLTKEMYMTNPVDGTEQGESSYGNGERWFGGLYWREPNFAGSEAITYQAENNSNLLDVCISLMKAEGCGFRVILDGGDAKAFYFELYRGVDRSLSQSERKAVVFDDALNNLAAQSFTYGIDGVKSAGYAMYQPLNDLLDPVIPYYADITADTTPFGSGSGIGTYRDNGHSGIDRDELGMTVSDIPQSTAIGATTQAKATYLSNAVKQICRSELDTYEAEKNYTVAINTDAAPVFGVDFDLGDTITCRNARWGVQMDAVVTESVETWEGGRHNVELTLGNSTTTLMSRFKQIRRRRG